MRVCILSALFVVLGLAGITSLAAAEEEESGTPCCFNNPRYIGTCVEYPDAEEKESCASILAYLNTPTSVGKDYCGRTTIRVGWQLVDCPESSRDQVACESSPQPRGSH